MQGGTLSHHSRFPGRWVAYEGTNFSGEQYILEKGVYRNCEDWGATDCRIASAQPILQVRASDTPHFTRGPTGDTTHGAGGGRAGVRCQPAPLFLLPGRGTQPPFRLQGQGRQMGRRTWPPGGHDSLWGGGDALPPSPSPSAPPPQILLFSEPDFLGDHIAFEEDQDALPAAFIPRSCRVRGGR